MSHPSPLTPHSSPLPPPRLRTVTLGCKVNQYETEFVRQALAGIGYQDAAVNEPADLCLVNTCTVTHEGDSKSRQTIRQLAARNPGTRIIVMGCYATRAPDEVAALPGVAEVITDKRELPDLLGRFGIVDVPTGISTYANRQRAYVKVQDGCLLRCSFCIIPQVRPHFASRPVQHILDEVQRLVAGGYREMILTGIHLGHYGVEWNHDRPKHEWIRLANLVQRIAQLPGDFRIRLSSIEATEVTRELIAVMAAYPDKVCPHLHVSLQSGSDEILRRMRRRWCSKRIVDRCRLVQQSLDRPAFTTDVIVGFPGETDADFAATLNVVREIGFSKIHQFPFSPRRGTPAAEMTDQVPPPVKAARLVQLAALETKLRDRYYQSLRGMPLRVLIESPISERPGRMVGTACRYAPVELPGNVSMRKQFATIIAGDMADGSLQAVNK
ncbi:MAG TPA: tRNA (N(6)-L-threonylcarbamoyladenosine(37)-C(2))-methylthiotransferase MtaB [Pirellulales bacterium]|nr:tRNA (N(6)-L-threonylcarbamoyladenosine(37)-C(2))-methylthiotransferase MtaB [Pirellulales bacterium]